MRGRRRLAGIERGVSGQALADQRFVAVPRGGVRHPPPLPDPKPA